MKWKIDSFCRQAWADQRGQTLPWLVLGLTAFLCMTGMAIDVSRAYIAYDHLQASTNAAALAAAAVTYNTSGTTVSSLAAQYGSASGGLNPINGVQTVQTTATSQCLNILLPSGMTCSSSPAANSVKVVQSTSVPTYFLRLLGIKSIPLSTTAQAAMLGVAQMWNVAIIVDSTGSMSSTPDSNCTKYGYRTRFSCALAGIKDFLGATNPCAPGFPTCVSSNANVHISLFTFPNLSTSNVADEYTCGGTAGSEPYTFPGTTDTSYKPITYKPSKGSSWTATYQVFYVGGNAANTDANGYLSDYFVSKNQLNSTSVLTKAVNGCMKNSGGQGTYLAGAIYAAQASLLAEQKLNPNTRNAMIVLSDGEPEATSQQMGGGTLTGKSTYPDTNDQCQQAIKAANDAAYAGTRVYAVAYGSSSSGCNMDTSLVSVTYSHPLNVALSSRSSVTPCTTMKDIASSLSYFYADSSSGANACADSEHTTNDLQNIYLEIAASITNPQLLPKNAHN